MKLGRAHWLNLAASLALLLLGSAAWLSFQRVLEQREAARWHDHSLKVLLQLETVRSAALAGDQTTAEREFDTLSQMIADNPEQAQLLDRAHGYLGRPELAAALEPAARHERELLARREERLNEARSKTLTGLLGGSGLGLVLVVVAWLLLNRELKAHKLARERLQIAHDALGAQFQERTLELEQADAELQAQAAQARAAQQRVREQSHLLDKVHDAIIILDLEDRVSYWNQGAERLYGVSAGDALGRSLPVLVGQDPASAEVLTQADRVLGRRGEWRGELQQRTRDGRVLTVESHWSLISDGQGRPRAKVLLNSDVTEKVQLQRQFLRAQRLDSIGTMAGGVAHDLNNVLTPILMAVKLLQKDRPNLDRKALLATAQASVERGAEMVRQLLAFAGGVKGERVSLSLKRVVGEVRILLEHTLPKSIDLKIQAADELWPVRGDLTQLAQVLMNLCVNARDAMPQGGGLEVLAENVALDDSTVGVKHPDARPGRYVRVTVADTGTGIAPEVLDKMFDPFFTTKEMGKGTGLGLSTAQGIVKNHGGFIQVYSEVGHGTRVTVYLPASAEGAAASEGVRPVEAAPAPPPSGQGELILVVDDEPGILSTARMLLQTNGYRAETANGGEEGVRRYQELRGQVRAVLLDMMMPGMDGPATLRALQAIDPEVRVIASSGLTTSGRVGEALAAGARTFLQKPYSDELLLRTVHETIHSPA